VYPSFLEPSKGRIKDGLPWKVMTKYIASVYLKTGFLGDMHRKKVFFRLEAACLSQVAPEMIVHYKAKQGP
jgi:hypothetical protein